MKIAINSAPLNLEDQYRGIGKYTANLLFYLNKYDGQNIYSAVAGNDFKNNHYDIKIFPFFTPFKLLPITVYSSGKTIIVIHDLIPILYSSRFPLGYRGMICWRLNKLLLQKINLLITDSYISQQDISRICNINKKQIIVAYPPVSSTFKHINDAKALKAISKKYRLPEKFLLYIGDCNWNKNVSVLVKTALNLKFNLVLAGKVFNEKKPRSSHPWNKSLNEVLELSVNQPLIKMLGYIPEADLIGVYNLATVYIQPSFYEGFGLPVVEALLCGCPVISSTGGSLPEIAGNAAEYFDPYQEEELARKIKLVFNNKVIKQKLISNGYQQIKKFTPQKFVESFTNAYKLL